MRYPDTVRLATTHSDGYGDRIVTVLDDVPASFIMKSGLVHSSNADAESSSAVVYLSPANDKVLDNKNDLEGMYIITAPFGDKDWYRISSVNVAESKLLGNTIDNIYCKLQKVAGLGYVYIR